MDDWNGDGALRKMELPRFIQFEVLRLFSISFFSHSKLPYLLLGLEISSGRREGSPDGRSQPDRDERPRDDHWKRLSPTSRSRPGFRDDGERLQSKVVVKR